ncbi:hypothetical protein PT974_00624 [Cladobotryum mycophilum]|uniref:Outer spore wall protein 5 n=1 Tax=Cladobotryum mycophilum TaxID=491253 RepID=A0ABR0T2K2_9HYPO
MALLNPVYAFFIPLLFGITIPLAVFAGITTTFAFSILICRVIVVYLDIAVSLVTRSLIGLTKNKNIYFQPQPSSSSSSVNSNTISPSASTTLLRRHRRRRRSSVGGVSAGTVTPASEVGLGLIPSVGAERDFEGVGGWRMGDDDEIWTTINSRLELPDRQYSRNHHRTLSGGPTTPGDGGFLMMKGRTRSPEKKQSPTSPNSSRIRAPSASRFGFTGMGQSESYFPMTITPNKGAKRAPSSVM